MDFNFKHNLNFVKEILIIKFKILKEYKVNLWATVIDSTVWAFFLSIFLYVLSENFGDLLNWTYKEYIFFVIVTQMCGLFFGSFLWGSNLRVELLSGSFNLYLIRPVNYYLFYIFQNSFMFVLITSIPYMILFLIFINFIYIDYNLFQLFMLIVFLFVSGIYYFIAYRTLDSVAFFIKENWLFLRGLEMAEDIFYTYPATIFKNVVRFVAIVTPVAYFGAYSTSYFFNYISLSELLFHFYILLILIFLGIVAIYVMWKEGLKKYEAYN